MCYLRYHILYYILEMATENSLLTTFPFNHLDDNSFNLAIYELAHGPLNYNNDLFETLLFNPIDESPIASTFPFNIDPDSNLSFNMPVSEYMHGRGSVCR